MTLARSNRFPDFAEYGAQRYADEVINGRCLENVRDKGFMFTNNKFVLDSFDCRPGGRMDTERTG